MGCIEGIALEPNQGALIMESPTKKTTAALLAGLTAGGAAGAMLLAPGVSLAQEADDATTEDAEVVDETAPEAPEDRMRHGKGERLANLAEIIGIEQDALRTALQDGQTIAEVAEANGVATDALVDELVADATARLEERLAELPTHIEDLVNGELDFEGKGPRGGPFGGPPAEEAGN
jgi:hypothetical protein